MNERVMSHPGQGFLRFSPAKRIPLILVLSLCVAVTGCFDVGRDTEILRSSLLKSLNRPYEKEFELGLGMFTFGLARAGLSFLPVDPEARQALSALRAADVAVYRIKANEAPIDYAAMLAVADKAMAGHSSDRLLTVINNRELVVIYVPTRADSTRNLKVSLLVLNQRQVVIGSASSNLEPLLELAFNRADGRGSKGMP